mgnify:CR=1 FL=1
MGILQILGAVAIIWFWIDFFKVQNKNPENSEAYLSHERSFPVCDLGWVVPTLILAAIGNFFGTSFGIIWSLISGGALVFLGLIDLTYNTQQGRFSSNKGDLIMNLLVLIGGFLEIIYGCWNF